MKKKIIISALIVFALFIISAVTKHVDGARVRAGLEPECTFKVISEDGNKVTYWGLGYKVVRYPSVSPKESFSSNRGVKMGSWFMDYKPQDYNSIEIEFLMEDKTLDITNRNDIESISSLLKNSKYISEICDGINSHKIILDKEVYYVKDGCKEIQKGNKQAKVSDEDFAEFMRIIEKYINTVFSF